MTEDIKQLVVKDVETIINYDPRVVAQDVVVTEYEQGLQIECTLVYLPYYITETLRFRFDKDNGLLAN